MDAPAIKIVETVAIDYEADDGQLWSSERDAQNWNADRAMVAILGPELLDSLQTHVYTHIRNLAFEAPTLDIIILRGVLDRYLVHVLPAYMTLEGTFSFGTGRQIETPDGHTFDNRHKAALHVLELEFQKLWDTGQISVQGRKAITNTSKFAAEGSEGFKRDCTRYAFLRNLTSFFRMTDDKGDPLPGYEQRLRDALQAIIIARSKPIEGKERPAK